jgi:hypothetical protein
MLYTGRFENDAALLSVGSIILTCGFLYTVKFQQGVG